MIINEILTAQSDPKEELDRILARCCEIVLDGQENDSEFYGMVGACVVCPGGELVYGVNYQAPDGRRVHAEQAALERCADVTPECIIVTTLSPCNRPMDERSGESCEDLIAGYGIEHVYCGYKDPTQDQDSSIDTDNAKLKQLCKQLADTFLNEDASKIKEPTFADGTLGFTNHVRERATKRNISMADIVKVLERLEALRGNDLKKLPPTGFIVRSNAFDLAIIKSQDIETKKIEYKIVTVHTRLKPGAGQRVLYLEETVDPVSGAGAVTPTVPTKPKKQPLVRPVEPAAQVDINRHREDPNAATYKKPVKENFADGKVKGKSRPGRVKRAGASCSGSVTDLRARAKRASGERAKMYHWCANMKSGKKK